MPKGKRGEWSEGRDAPTESDVTADHVVEGSNPSPDSNSNGTDHIKRLKPFRRQVRRHTERNLAMIGDSLQQVGFGRSILIDENDEILAGAGTVEAAGERGLEQLRIIDITGDEVIALRRSNMNDDEKLRMAIFDNRASDIGDYDVEKLKAALAHLQQTGGDPKVFFNASELRMLEDREVAHDMRQKAGGGNSDAPPAIPKGYVAFSLVISEDANKEIRETLEEIKSAHSLNTIAEALLVVIRAFRKSRDPQPAAQ